MNKSCYIKMNTRGDHFGHCGMKNTKYERCDEKHALCGRVQCDRSSSLKAQPFYCAFNSHQ
jgi:hypothetical protein